MLRKVIARQHSRFIEPQRNKRETTPLPRSAASKDPVGGKKVMKIGTSSSTNGPYDSTSTNKGRDSMTWANTWEMMNRTLEAFATTNTDSSERGGGKIRKKPSKNQNNLKTT